VRLLIEQVSAVEHAIAVGVPRRDRGGVRMTEGWAAADRDHARASRRCASWPTAGPAAAGCGDLPGTGLVLVSIGFAAAVSRRRPVTGRRLASRA
jgi:hypothetical protein